MFRPLTIAFGISAVLGVGLPGRAAPITYDFRGTFDRPMNGTAQFSGSFSFNPDPTSDNLGYVVDTQEVISRGVAQPAAYSFVPNKNYSVSEYGNDVSLTVNMGGRVIHYTNTPQNPYAARLIASPLSYSMPSGGFGPLMDYIVINGVTADYAPGHSFSNNSFGLSFISPTDTVYHNLAPGQVANLGYFDFATTTFHGISAAGPSGGSYEGTITSIEMVTTPEPSTLIIFTFLGIAARALRSYRRK